MTIREQILAAATAAITDEVQQFAVVPGIYRSRAEAFRPGQLPAICIRPESDTPGDRDSTLCWCPWVMVLSVDIVVSGGPVCTETDDLAAAVHHALMVSSNPPGGEDLGLSEYAVDVAPGPADWVPSNEGEPVGMMTMRFTIRYQTSWGSLELFR